MSGRTIGGNGPSLTVDLQMVAGSGIPPSWALLVVYGELGDQRWLLDINEATLDAALAALRATIDGWKP